MAGDPSGLCHIMRTDTPLPAMRTGAASDFEDGRPAITARGADQDTERRGRLGSKRVHEHAAEQLLFAQQRQRAADIVQQHLLVGAPLRRAHHGR